VSDEFTVPICRGHHRQLYQTGDEEAWWKNIKIDALKAARDLWEQTHPASIMRSPSCRRGANKKVIAKPGTAAFRNVPVDLIFFLAAIVGQFW